MIEERPRCFAIHGLKAAKVIAKHAEENELVPSLLHPEVHKEVTAAVGRAALESGVIKHWD